MATSDGSKKVEDGVLDGTAGTAAPARRARTAAEQRAQRSSGSDDPETIVNEIERTREDLAETLDAIADKVSPKRVASRTKRKVSDAVKEGAAEASATVKEKAATASDAAKSGAASVKETVQEKVQSHSGTAATTPAPTTGALADASDTASLRVSGLEPAGADIPPLPAVTSSSSVVTYGAPSTGLPKELLAGAGAAIAVLLLVLRRRKRR